MTPKEIAYFDLCLVVWETGCLLWWERWFPFNNEEW